MQGIDADGVVGVGVLPGLRHVRIVDGQHLQHALFRLGTPVDHLFQITEVTHTETAFTAEGENGNHRTGSLPGINGKMSLLQFIDHHFALFQLGQGDFAVLTVLPEWCHVFFIVETYELKLEGRGQGVGIEADHPLVVLMLSHLDGAQGFPVAQRLASTHNGQPLIVAQLWGTYFQAHRLGVGCLRTHVQLPGSHTFRESC